MEKAALDNGSIPAPGVPYAACAILILWALCSSYSLLRAPVPGPNEPHYLTKARHFWDPNWCSRDFFLESSNPHAVFYALIGWLPEQFGFETTAVIGRLAAALLLAIGWYTLCTATLQVWWASIIALGLLLLSQAAGNLSGEWIVGGVESKTFSYGLAFLGWGLFMRGRLIPGSFCLGLCFSLHPVIGAWVFIATGIAWLQQVFVSRHRQGSLGASTRPSTFPHLFAACGFAALGMLPGIWACLPIIAEGSSPEADLLQVERRLSHHLDPFDFTVGAWRAYALLLVIWGLVAWIKTLQQSRQQKSLPFTTDRGPATRFLRTVVGASLLFAIAGIAVAWGDRPFSDLPGATWRAALLKFYPFRLVDVLLPVVVAIELSHALAIGLITTESPPGTRPRMRFACVLVAVGLPLLTTWCMPYSDRPASQMDPDRETDWRAICQWLKANVGEEALLWAADERWAVKWYAERAEYVNYKDCPQDGVGLLEWQRRQDVLSRWTRTAVEDRRFTIEDFDRLYNETGITHIVCSRMGPMPAELRLLHEVGDFNVYAIYTEETCPCEANTTPPEPSPLDNHTSD